MANDEFGVAIDILSRILAGKITNFSELESALSGVGKTQAQLAIVAVFENLLGYPQNSLDSFLRIVQDFSQVKTGNEEPQVYNKSLCLICMALLRLPQEPHRSVRGELLRKLYSLISPVRPDVAPLRFVPHQNSLKAMLSSTQKRLEQSFSRLSAKDKELSFLSFVAGDRASKSCLDQVAKEFSGMLDFECEEAESYQQCDECHILIRSKQGEEGKYNCGLLLVPVETPLSSALAKKMEDKFLAQLMPSAQLDIVFYFQPATVANASECWPGIKRLLQFCPEGLGGYVTNNYHVIFAEHVIASLAQMLQLKIRDKQINYFYYNLAQQPGCSEDAMILQADGELQKIPFFQFGNDQGKVQFLAQETFWTAVKGFYLHGMYLSLSQADNIANIYRRLLPSKKA